MWVAKVELLTAAGVCRTKWKNEIYLLILDSQDNFIKVNPLLRIDLSGITGYCDYRTRVILTSTVSQLLKWVCPVL